jgi:catechol 2,3-dioxygenase-like lactoylglutathione lyase family enzyme
MASTVNGVAHLLLQVSDLNKAEEFYVGVLGFTVRKREPFAGDRELIVTNQGLGLTTGGPGDGTQVEHIAFEVDGVREIADRAKAANAELLSELGPGAYGLTIYVADPDGNKIELFEPEAA